MNLGHVEAIADAVLYEGYLLYPYRTSALKNRARWTFGVLIPQGESEASGGVEASSLQSECLVVGSADSEIEVAIRFLHPIRREIRRVAPPATEMPEIGAEHRAVESLQVGARLLEAGEEGAPVRIDAGPLRMGDLAEPGVRCPFVSPSVRHADAVRDEAGRVAAAVVRERGRLEGTLEVTAAGVADGVYKLTVRVSNVTPVPDVPGSGLTPPAWLVSTHLVLGVRAGQFVPPRDPPAALRSQAEACRNTGAWPVLVGARGRRDSVLCSPIILDDYPAVAPESPGDFFDGTEIDELITLRILTLTGEERRRMSAADERTRALLERTDSLGWEQLMRLHGALRRTLPEDRPGVVVVGGARLGPGDRVRLRPRAGRDILDLALAGRSATIVSIEQDYDGRVYVTVTVDDDPGRDLGVEGKPGHRFFFDPEEVESLPEPRV